MWGGGLGCADGCQKGRIPLFYTSAQSVCLTVCYSACVCVCECTWEQVNTKSITTNPRVETCNSDRFTRMRPQIYGCAPICMGVSVFSGETLCVTQDKLVFVKSSRSRDSEPQFGVKMEREHIMISARNSEYVRASSGQQVASVFQ